MLRFKWIAGAGLSVLLFGCDQIEALNHATDTTADAGIEVSPGTVDVAPASDRVTEGNLVMENIPKTVRERLRQYQNVRGHNFSDWADEGILISTRFGETSQVHHVKEPGAARKQVTFYDEPVGGGDVSPTGGGFVFAKDTGGDEFFQGFLFDLATGGVTQFTESGTRNGGLVWRDAGGAELGAAWRQESKDGETPYLAVKLDDPNFAAPMRAAFFENEGDGTGVMVWTRVK